MSSSNIPVGSVLSYRVNLAAAIVYAAVYISLGSALILRCLKAGSRWGLVLGIGAICQGLGFIVRIIFRSDQTSIPLYAIQQLVIVVSPACYFAFNYVLFGRIASKMSRDHCFHKSRNLTVISPQYVATFFVTSDVVTFLLQIAGGGMQAIPGLSKIGDPIFLAGIVIQFASYIIYLLLILRMRFLVLPELRKIVPIGAKVDNVLLLIAWSSIWIIVRCIFRTAELSEGYGGRLYNEEIYFLVLDAMPLVLAIVHYLIVWPSQNIDLNRKDQGFLKDIAENEQEVELMRCT